MDVSRLQFNSFLSELASTFKHTHGFRKVIATFGEFRARYFEILQQHISLGNYAFKFLDLIVEMSALLIELVAMPSVCFFFYCCCEPDCFRRYRN